MKINRLCTIVGMSAAFIIGGCGSSDNSEPDTTDTSSSPSTPANPSTSTPSNPSIPSNPSNPSASSGDLSQFGFINVNQYRADIAGDIEVDITAGFFSGDQLFDSTQARNGLFPAVDTCLVDSDSDDSLLPEINGLDVQFTSLSAGEVITVTSTAGTYASVPQMSGFGIIGYGLETELTGAAPSGLVVDIPGDQFPSFSGLQFPDAMLVEGISPTSDTQISANTVYSWTPSTDSNARIQITVDNIDCLVLDDGSFTIPASIISQASPDFSDGFELGQTNVTFVESGNALLVLVATTES